MTTYYRLTPTRIKVERDGNEERDLTMPATLRVVNHILMALNVYEKDGFRFVDVDASMTGLDITICWSNYGLYEDRPPDA